MPKGLPSKPPKGPGDGGVYKGGKGTTISSGPITKGTGSVKIKSSV